MDKVAISNKEEQEQHQNTLHDERKARREQLKNELLMQKRIAKRRKRSREKQEEKYNKELLIGKGEYVPDPEPEPEPTVENGDEQPEGNILFIYINITIIMIIHFRTCSKRANYQYKCR
jgi:hypothetical protein